MLYIKKKIQIDFSSKLGSTRQLHSSGNLSSNSSLGSRSCTLRKRFLVCMYLCLQIHFLWRIWWLILCNPSLTNAHMISLSIWFLDHSVKPKLTKYCNHGKTANNYYGKYSNSFNNTSGPLIMRFLGLGKNRTNWISH